jgi:dimethylargininase
MIPTHAIVRPPGDTYPNALTQLDPPPPVDLNLARQQHAAYEAALRACGLEVIALPPDPDHPDSVFVQDPVLVVDGRAIVCRSAAESRRGEADALVEVLRPHMEVVELQPPATLDGGDVLIADRRLYVGLSTRSNRAACEQLGEVTGWPVEGIPLPDDLLHLLSGCTRLGANRLLVVESLARLMPGFKHILVPGDEEQAANVFIVGHHAIVPAGYPKTATLVAQCGFEIHLVPMSEYEKRDGGVTCSALLF